MASLELDLDIPITIEYQIKLGNKHTLPPTPTERYYLKVFLTKGHKQLEITDFLPNPLLDELYDLCLREG
jgi:hypothetical protein